MWLIGDHYQGWPLALMQNRPGGEESIGGLDDPGARGDGDTGLQKMLILCGMWIWPNEKGDFIYGCYTWVNMRHGKLWRITRGRNVRIPAWWIVKYGLEGFQNPSPSPHLMIPHTEIPRCHPNHIAPAQNVISDSLQIQHRVFFETESCKIVSYRMQK